MYTKYEEIMNLNKKDFRPIKNKKECLKDIHIKGRFSESWKN